MKKMENIKFSVDSYFYGKNFCKDYHVKHLSKNLSQGLWEFIECTEDFKAFFLDCLNNVEKLVGQTGQHISNVQVNIEVYDRNCDVDEMVCKNIAFVFNTIEGTHKEFEFAEKISLSDFNLPSNIAVKGVFLIELIRKYVNKEGGLNVIDKYGIIVSFLIPFIVSIQMTKDFFFVFSLTFVLGIMCSYIVVDSSGFWLSVWRHKKGYEYTYVIELNIQTPGVCCICGCTETAPCFNPGIGTSWWANEERTLCSHCADPKIARDLDTVHCIKTKRI